MLVTGRRLETLPPGDSAAAMFIDLLLNSG